MLGFVASKAMLMVVIAAVGSGGYFYVQSLRSQLQAAVEAQQKLEDAIAAKELVMKQVQEDIEKIRKLNADLNIKFSNAQRDVSDLEKKFQDAQGRQRDFARAATQNPKALQDKINRGTQFALRCNEIATGSPLKPEDDKNNICQELIKSKKAEKK
jgi:septal ring factor EnvC (AmiA/AmiB activator)